MSSVTQTIGQAPLDEVLGKVTCSIIETQEHVNKAALDSVTVLSGADASDRIQFGSTKYSMLDLGFEPYTYQLTDTSVELKLALSMTQEQDGSTGVKAAFATSDYCNKYQYDISGACTVQATVTPSTPADVFETRVGKMIEESAKLHFKDIQSYQIAGDASALTINKIECTNISDIIDSSTALEDYRAALLESDYLTDSTAFQTLINQVNALIDIRAICDKEETDTITIKQIRNTGVSSTITDNLTAYQEAIARSDQAEALKTLSSFYELMYNANLKVIKDLNDAGYAGSLTLSQLEAVGIENVTSDNTESYQDAVATFGAGYFESADTLQQLINKVNLAVIREYKNQGSATSLTVAQLTAAGAENAIDENLSQYQTQVIETELALTEVAELQEVVDAANLAVIQKYSEKQKASYLNMNQLEAVRVEDAVSTLLDEYKDAIDEAEGFEDLAALQAIIDAVNALDTIQTYRFMADASELDTDLLTKAGVQDIVEANLDAYKTQIENAISISSLSALQTLIDQVNNS